MKKLHCIPVAVLLSVLLSCGQPEDKLFRLIPADAQLVISGGSLDALLGNAGTFLDGWTAASNPSSGSVEPYWEGDTLKNFLDSLLASYGVGFSLEWLAGDKPFALAVLPDSAAAAPSDAAPAILILLPLEGGSRFLTRVGDFFAGIGFEREPQYENGYAVLSSRALADFPPENAYVPSFFSGSDEGSLVIDLKTASLPNALDAFAPYVPSILRQTFETINSAMTVLGSRMAQAEAIQASVLPSTEGLTIRSSLAFLNRTPTREFLDRLEATTMPAPDPEAAFSAVLPIQAPIREYLLAALSEAPFNSPTLRGTQAVLSAASPIAETMVDWVLIELDNSISVESATETEGIRLSPVDLPVPLSLRFNTRGTEAFRSAIEDLNGRALGAALSVPNARFVSTLLRDVSDSSGLHDEWSLSIAGNSAGVVLAALIAQVPFRFAGTVVSAYLGPQAMERLVADAQNPTVETLSSPARRDAVSLRDAASLRLVDLRMSPRGLERLLGRQSMNQALEIPTESGGDLTLRLDLDTSSGRLDFTASIPPLYLVAASTLLSVGITNSPSLP